MGGYFMDSFMSSKNYYYMSSNMNSWMCLNFNNGENGSIHKLNNNISIFNKLIANNKYLLIYLIDNK
jgi:hypothetical protein